jgi:uncharacterized protein YxeA
MKHIVLCFLVAIVLVGGVALTYSCNNLNERTPQQNNFVSPVSDTMKMKTDTNDFIIKDPANAANTPKV